MCKEMYVEVYKRCGGCVNEDPGKQSHDYCLIVDPATKTTECYDNVSKVDRYLANDLCFEKVQDMNPVPARNIDLYVNRNNFLETLNRKNKLRSKFIKACLLTEINK